MTDLNALRQRLESLERENRRMKRWGGVVALTLGAVFLTGQAAPKPPDPKIIRAQQFVVVDANGQQRGVLSAEDTGVALILGGQTLRGESLGGGGQVVLLSARDTAAVRATTGDMVSQLTTSSAAAVVNAGRPAGRPQVQLQVANSKSQVVVANERSAAQLTAEGQSSAMVLMGPSPKEAAIWTWNNGQVNFMDPKGKKMVVSAEPAK